MKNKILVFLLAFFLGSVFSSYSQDVVAQRQPVSAKSVPEIVKSAFKKQYPDVLLKGWYSTHLVYWQNDYSSDWYQNWYGQRTVVIFHFQKPNYYEVEFVNNPGELSRAIYNIYGYWYETRTQIRVLPLAIQNALKDSKYQGWNISKVKETLESPAWPIEIFRFQVYKGIKSKIISMDIEGNFIQIKDIND